jgi:hypothetical protein
MFSLIGGIQTKYKYSNTKINRSCKGEATYKGGREKKEEGEYG